MIFWCIPLVILFYMLGGQINKLFRPIGVPLSIIGIYYLSHNQPFWYCLPVLWYAFTLTLGYGVNSKLMKYFQSEQTVRIVLGISSALPIIVIAAITMKWLLLIWVPIIVGVECIRLGKWFSIGKFDVLPVDILRALVVSVAVSLGLI